MAAFSRATSSVDLEDILSCPECGSVHLEEDYARGELVCANCGLVINEKMIDQGQEWREFDMKERESKSRTGGPVTYALHDKGLPTEISWKNVDIFGKSVPSKNKSQLYRIRGLQRRLRVANSTERHLMVAFCSIERVCSNMSLPKSAKECAALLYRKAMSSGVVKGRSMECVAAVCIYVTSRIMNVPRTIDEVSHASGIPRREISRAYRVMARKLKLSLKPTVPHDYISRFCSELSLDTTVQRKSLEILRRIEDSQVMMGKGPQGSAAAAIYLAAAICGFKATQEKIARVSGITEATLRNRLEEISAGDLDISEIVLTTQKAGSDPAPACHGQNQKEQEAVMPIIRAKKLYQRERRK